MPAACLHFRLLHERVTELAKKFVDDQVHDELANPTGFKPDFDHLAAFRLLVHAELEVFLEAKARENVQAILERMAAGTPWMRQSPQLLALTIALKHPIPHEDVLEAARHTTFVIDLLNAARAKISKNNGVKAQAFALRGEDA
jgi:hypothetical protein